MVSGLAGAGGVLSESEGNKLKDFAWGIGRRSNNDAEWLAMIKGLEIARKEETKDLVVFGDSMLVIREARTLATNRKNPVTKIHHLFNYIVSEFNSVNFFHLLRTNNQNADVMANVGAGLDCGIMVSNRKESGIIGSLNFSPLLVMKKKLNGLQCNWKWQPPLAWRKHLVFLLIYTTLRHRGIGFLNYIGIASPSSDPPHIFSVIMEPSTRGTHLARMHDLKMDKDRGKALYYGRGSIILGKMLGSSRVTEVRVKMDEAAAISSLPSLQCLCCKKHIKSLERNGSVGVLRMPFANDAAHEMDLGGSVKVHHAMHEHCKAEALGMGKNWSSFIGDNSGINSPVSVLGFGSLPVEVQTYLKEMEVQVHKLRGENSELKRSISHLYTLVQVTNPEIRSNSSKLTEQVAILAGKFENGCPCSVNLDTKIMSLHNSLGIVEAKIDNMRAYIRNSITILHGGVGGIAGDVDGSKVDNSHQ